MSTRAGLCSRPSGWRTRTSAIGASTRSSPSTSLPFGNSRRRRSVPSARTSPDGAVYLFWDARHSTPDRARDLGNELADRLREGGFSVDRVLVEDLRPVPAVCAMGGLRADEHGPQHRVAFP